MSDHFEPVHSEAGWACYDCGWEGKDAYVDRQVQYGWEGPWDEYLCPECATTLQPLE